MTTPAPQIDYLTDELWECDGCGLVDRQQAVNAHIIEQAYWPDGTLKAAADARCLQAYQVGGPIWNDVQSVEGEYLIRDYIRKEGHPD
jgi:hypothetical protein